VPTAARRRGGPQRQGPGRRPVSGHGHRGGPLGHPEVAPGPIAEASAMEAERAHALRRDPRRIATVTTVGPHEADRRAR